jgi:hypothetical protein
MGDIPSSKLQSIEEFEVIKLLVNSSDLASLPMFDNLVV